jgi:hypothetical protein
LTKITFYQRARSQKACIRTLGHFEIYETDPRFSNRDITRVNSLLSYFQAGISSKGGEERENIGSVSWLFEARHIPKGGGFVPSI